MALPLQHARFDAEAIAAAANGSERPGAVVCNAHLTGLAGMFVFPFAEDAVVKRILDKSELYRKAEAAGIPYPKTVDTRQVDEEVALAEIGVPCVLKPAAKRPFYDAFGANLFTPKTAEEF